MLVEKINSFETLCPNYCSLGSICVLFFLCYVLFVQLEKIICADFTNLLHPSTKARFCHGYCVRRVKKHLSFK